MTDNQPLTVPSNTKVEEPKRMHVDEFIHQGMFRHEDPRAYAAFVLEHFRKAAWWRSMTDQWMNQFKLFGTYNGKRYRVTGASRLGDVWLQEDFDKDHGYNERVDVLSVSDWSATP